MISSLILTVAGLHGACVTPKYSTHINSGIVRVIAYLNPRHSTCTACLRTLGEFRPVCEYYLVTAYLIFTSPYLY